MATTGQYGSSQRPGEQTRREPGMGQRSQTEQSTAGNIVNTVTEKVQDMASGAKDTLQEWSSSAADVAGQASQRAQELARSAAETAGNFGEELTSLIRRYPMQALLLGVGIGFC